METAIVHYSEGQVDEEGNPVVTTPFAVFYDPEDGDTTEDAIRYTGDVQFGWELDKLISESSYYEAEAKARDLLSKDIDFGGYLTEEEEERVRTLTLSLL